MLSVIHIYFRLISSKCFPPTWAWVRPLKPTLGCPSNPPLPLSLCLPLSLQPYISLSLSLALSVPLICCRLVGLPVAWCLPGKPDL